MSRVADLLAELDHVGRDARGGWSRHGFTQEDQALREWFTARARGIGLAVEQDRNGNLWAWWGAPGRDAVVTGSHLDSVPGGGRLDGPLGVASALVAVERMRAAGFVPARPLAVAVFVEEEGSRFGVACLGTRLLTGTLDPDRAGALADRHGVTLADAAAAAGVDPRGFGRDDALLGRIGVFIELHVEQGRGLVELDEPVGLATGILAHGRWRIVVTGRGDHAGSTRMGDRVDPVVAAARAILAVEAAALETDGARATVGRVDAVPGGTNVIASSVALTLDVRADTNEATRALVLGIELAVADAVALNGCSAVLEPVSWSDAVVFDAVLRDELDGALGGLPALPTGAGHDSGVLASAVPTAMLFVRNPTGVSHAPAEHADTVDLDAGVDALELALRFSARERPGGAPVPDASPRHAVESLLNGEP